MHSTRGYLSLSHPSLLLNTPNLPFSQPRARTRTTDPLPDLFFRRSIDAHTGQSFRFYTSFLGKISPNTLIQVFFPKDYSCNLSTHTLALQVSPCERKKGELVVGTMRAISSDVLSCRCVSTPSPRLPALQFLHQVIDRFFFPNCWPALTSTLFGLAVPTSK
ncbi:hypothetical protein COCMIDRAFT_89946 [Bipolaris oryzae ATCC 44560]|uniref:Uncharacterized protein n=1 Tax=Bipolaris oryzae ATCC 44560 TaxID=930090 RepID=W6ZUJ4_COCMI|nr:uncharacterized protein COCMIDRAFT_89946 [Bipolaris oryzae ATCC 44560]EUC47451.1 hypothetical protein COCMIDRAFT_89946 [Bipolaris oryzae ATCC 44560]